MKQDLDRLLVERKLDAAIVVGSTHSSPFIYYLTGGAKLEDALIILRPGQPGLLIHSPLERDDAVETGYCCVPYTHWDLDEIHRAADGDRLRARVELLRQILGEFHVRGRVGFYGHGEIGSHHALLDALEQAMPDLEVVTEFGDDPFTLARLTKDESEIAAMQQVGRLTCEVVAEVADLLSSRPVAGHHLLAADGEPMTVDHIKRFVRQELVRRGLEEPTENIFSIGADSGVPHNRGRPDAILELGKTIIFDIFPRPLGGGYYHDMTRTWCLGYAPTVVAEAYEDVKAAFEQAVAALSVGRPLKEYQELVCEFFQSRGHPTIISEPQTTAGYVHSLGHGLGLEVHEAPRLSHRTQEDRSLQPGMVFTIEPGLYYPEQGFGVRLEDTYYCDAHGQFHTLTPFPMDLVLPVRQ